METYLKNVRGVEIRFVNYKNCKVRLYSEEKNINFCFQCADFPCGTIGFDEHLNKRSVDIK